MSSFAWAFAGTYRIIPVSAGSPTFGEFANPNMNRHPNATFISPAPHSFTMQYDIGGQMGLRLTRNLYAYGVVSLPRGEIVVADEARFVLDATEAADPSVPLGPPLWFVRGILGWDVPRESVTYPFQHWQTPYYSTPYVTDPGTDAAAVHFTLSVPNIWPFGALVCSGSVFSVQYLNDDDEFVWTSGTFTFW